MNVEFVNVREAVQLQSLHMSESGGTKGLRDKAALESAIAQAFVDGNKRTGLSTAHAFLKLNGIEVFHDDVYYEEMTLAVARGELGKDEVEELLRAAAE